MARLIVCIGRETPPQEAVKIAEAALRFQSAGVVGLDLACDEIAYPPELHIPAYQLTVGSKLRRTVHAGEHAATEDKRVQNIQTAITDLHADGLGHAVSLARHPNIMREVAEKRIRVESCPLSNKISGAIGDLRELGLDTLLEQNVRVSLNTDDPLMFGTSLADVFRATCEAYGFGIEHVRHFVRNAVEGAFCSPRERAKIYAEFVRRGFSLFPQPQGTHSTFGGSGGRY